MSTGTLTPSPYQTVLDSNGNPVSGAKIYTYLAGTTTAASTYSDSALSVANANPIIADSAGRFVAYLTPGASYKFVYQTSAGAAILTQDNIGTVPPATINNDVTGTAGEALTAGQLVYLSDGSASKTAGQWYNADLSNAYSSLTPMLGFAVANIAAGASGTIRLAGRMSGLTALTVGSTYYVGTSGALTSTRPAAARFVGVADTVTSLVLAPDPPVLSVNVQTTTSTGTQNDFNASVSGNLTVLRCNNASLLTITGINAGVDGQRLMLVSLGTGQVDLAHQNTGSAAANRLINFATSGNTSLAAGAGAAEYVYDATTARWRLVWHEQGAYITRTFAAGNYTASTGNWTVASATRDAYYLRGRQLTFSEVVSGTTSGTPTTVRIALPFTANASEANLSAIIANGSGAAATGTWSVASSSTTFSVALLAGGSFGAGTVSINVVATFEVQ